DDDDDDDDECCHHHHHDHEHEHEHEHDHDHEHHHDHDHEHHHHHHHGHDADEVFASWGMETARRFSEEELRELLEDLSDSYRYGTVLRAKGIVAADAGPWIHFDYTPGEIDIRRGSAGVTGRLCVIGAQLKEDAVAELFG
ncbi:MAG: GTP-binding protein, partial [Oscillospiraceae bacterium]|nr:GTP-binding protein [Oscillospiraceae bacterium]